MAKRKKTEPALLQKGKRETFQDKMDRLIGQSPFQERDELKRQLQDETFKKVIGEEKEKELRNRLNQLLNRDVIMLENKAYLDKRKDFLDNEKFKIERDALRRQGETIKKLNERDIDKLKRQNKQEGGLLADDREKFVFGTSTIAKMITNLVKKSPTPKQFKNDKIIKELDKTVEYHQNRIKNHDYEAEIESAGGRDAFATSELQELSPEFDKLQIEIILKEKDDLIKKAIKENKTPTEILKELQSQELEEFPKRSPLNVGGELQNPEKADLDNDGKLSSYEKARGEAIEENMRDKKAVGGLGGMFGKVIHTIRTNPQARQKLGMPELETDEYGQLKPLPPARISAQVGGMMMDDQMADMLETEEPSDMDNQMADMMPEEKTAEQKAIEKAQAPDEEMEENYVDFLIDEALDDEEEEMLMKELQANPKLSMLFDKVMEVAMEFSGSGPVEGPGSEVSDSIPARLSDGEFVFTAKAVDVLGVDNLMSLMKQAEAQADERQTAQDGGLMEEEDTVMPVEQQPVRQDIRVTKETVGSQAAMQEEDDLVGDEIKKSMLSNRPYVRS
tara:strand:- start:534 stop:2219 length:1686 start_codon:yes stop_codon:yes gene_type:complete